MGSREMKVTPGVLSRWAWPVEAMIDGYGNIAVGLFTPPGRNAAGRSEEWGRTAQG